MRINAFLVHIYCNHVVKRVILPDEMEREEFVMIPPSETTGKHSIILRFCASNGIWSIDPKYSHLSHADDNHSWALEQGTLHIWHKRAEMDIDIHAFQLEREYTRSIKCSSTSSFNIFKTDKGVLQLGGVNRSELLCATYKRHTERVMLDAENDCTIYLNGTKIKSAELCSGDIVLIHDVCMVYLDDIIAVSACPSILPIINLPTYEHKKEQPHTNQEPPSDEYFQPSYRVFPRLYEGAVPIDPPPPKHEPNGTPMILTIGASGSMFLVMLFSVMLRSQNSQNPVMLYASLLMIVGSAIGTVVMPLLLRRYQNNKNTRDEHKRVTKYKRYIDALNKYLIKKHQENRALLHERYFDIERAYEVTTFKDKTMQNNTLLWNKSAYQQDFLDIRIGVGVRKSTIEIETPKESFTLVSDPMRKYAQILFHKFEHIIDVPVSVSLFDNYIVGITGTRAANIAQIKAMILQICANYSYEEVKLIFIINPEEYGFWNFVKWLPHCFTSDKAERFIASTKTGAYEVFSFLDKLYENRKENSKNIDHNVRRVGAREARDVILLPHYIVFALSEDLMEDTPIALKMLEYDEYYGISFIYLANTFNLLPQKTDIIIQNTSAENSIYTNNDASNRMRMFTRDDVSKVDFDRMARTLFSTRLINTSENANVPEKLSFLAMYNAANIEELNVPKRWESNKATEGIESLIGVSAESKPFMINIHERFHGPHGLMAGMTGSGKSEFIQSFILSIAINYSPNQVSFILIDYKGGGMASQFEGLPHLAGIITNLEGSEIERSLNTLKTELDRRQKVFKNAGVNNIDKYHERFENMQISEPMPHLLIIADEFAELKHNQQAFMQALVSTARIGRSLGVHLILATQHPSNVVDEEIWSNSMFRICLRVLSRTDSNDMLKRPEAADIRVPGRAYVQVGNNEIFTLIQSGYSGAPYEPKDFIETDDQKTVSLLDEGAHAVKSRQRETDAKGEKQTQLSAIVEYLAAHAEKCGYRKSTLWKPILDKTIYLSQITRGYKPRPLAPCIGKLDDTAHQDQPLFELPFLDKGHVLLYGLPGSGKTTFIQTLVTSIALSYGSDQVHIYVLDFATHSMGYFNELPHVGDVLFDEDSLKLNKFFSVMEQILKDRKYEFSLANVSNYKSYQQITDTEVKSMPAIINIVHDYATLRDAHPDSYDVLARLVATGGVYGMYFVLIANNFGSIPSKISGNITNVLAMRLKDKYEYSSAFSMSSVLMPLNTPGRGVTKLDTVIEFQIALASEGENDAQRIAALKTKYALIAQASTTKPAPNIPIIPNPYIIIDELPKSAYKDAKMQNRIPIGMDVAEIDLVALSVEQMHIFPICGFSKSGKSNFCSAITETALSFGFDVFIFDNASYSQKAYATRNNVVYGRDEVEYGRIVAQLNEICVERIQRRAEFLSRNAQNRAGDFMLSLKPVMIVIDDFNDFINMITDDDLPIFGRCLDKLKRINICLVSTLNPDILDSAVKLHCAEYKLIYKERDGLLLGNGYDKVSTIFPNYRFDRKLQTAVYPAGRGLLFTEQVVRPMVTPLAY